MKRWLIIVALIILVFSPLAFFAFSEQGLQLRDESLAFIKPQKPQVPENVELHYDVAYGTHARHKLDIYLPKNKPANRLPVILLVHGGGWYAGDKVSIPTTANADYFTTHGWMLVSINYRLLPEVTVIEQAQDITHAVAYIQKNAAYWNADPQQVHVMGHSSGGHIVALATAQNEWIKHFGGSPWASSVGLDASAYDLVDSMDDDDGFSFFSPIIGTDPAKWPSTSPAHNLKKGMPPLLAVCDRDRTCGHPYRMVKEAEHAKIIFQIQPEALDHFQIVNEFGKDNEYTKKIFAFIQKYKSE